MDDTTNIPGGWAMPLLDAMCFTMRHDFFLLGEDKQEELRQRYRPLFEHHVKPLVRKNLDLLARVEKAERERDECLKNYRCQSCEDHDAPVKEHMEAVSLNDSLCKQLVAALIRGDKLEAWQKKVRSACLNHEVLEDHASWFGLKDIILEQPK